MADHSFADEVSGLEVSLADAEDHCCADNVEAEDTLPEIVHQQIAEFKEEVSEEEIRSSSEFRGTHADSVINQVTGRTIVLTG